ncbi:MAG: gliding motility-associated ABC transporter substrate-binding protein GldG [Bacteroidota bacterium]
MAKNKKIQSFVQLGLMTGILIFLNILGSAVYSHIDLTEDKRFTLSEPTVEMIEDLDEVIFVKILLQGQFPAGFKRLQRATVEMLDEFRSISSLIEYEFEDPNEGTVEQKNQARKMLEEQGIRPTTLFIKDGSSSKNIAIYPFAILYYKGRQFTVNLLESEMLGVPNQVVLNNSVSLLEYKFANAIQKLQLYRKRPILFLQGHGELLEVQTADLRKSIKPYYNYGDVRLDSIYSIKPEVAALIVAKPRTPFSERDKFIIDQYVMNGGKVLWLIDALNVNLDSLRRQREYIPLPYDLNLESMLFKYGARIQPNLLLDWFATQIPMVTGTLGSGNQFELFKWFYHPLVSSASEHPVSKGLDRVNMFFPSTIDTIRTKTPVKKTVLLASSERSRMQKYLTRLNFEILRYKPDATKFNAGRQPVAVMLEGIFPSAFDGRVSESMREGLQQINQDFKPRSEPTRMLVVSDGDVPKNLYDPRTKKISPMGYNQFEQVTFGNKDFMINAIEYLLDDTGVIEARSKEVKLRLLDTAKAREESTKWQVFNIGMPLVFLAIFGFIYLYIRRRRFAQP